MYAIRSYYGEYMEYDDPLEIDNIGSDIGCSRPFWEALISVEDERLCHYIANCISSVFMAPDLDEEEAEDRALPRMDARNKFV